MANTAILGALAAAELVGLDAVDQAIREAFPDPAGEANVRAARTAFDLVAAQRREEVWNVTGG